MVLEALAYCDKMNEMDEVGMFPVMMAKIYTLNSESECDAVNVPEKVS